VFRAVKVCMLLSVLAMTFVAVVAVVSALIPPPLGAVDHLVAGCIATFVILLIVFGLSVQGGYRA